LYIHTQVACLYALRARCSISLASSLSWFTSSLQIAKSRGNPASTMLSKCARSWLSLDLYRKARQIASRHCRPASAEFALLVFSSSRVNSRNRGHRLGKSHCKMRCRTGMSCWRTRPSEEARIGTKRSRIWAFSSSAIELSVGMPSTWYQERFTRFLM
jgi:hypothetical protein